MITLPVYLVVDTSGSLIQEIDAINQGLASLFESLSLQAIVADTVRIALVQFSSDATLAIPLTAVSDIKVTPSLQAHGRTNYGAAFSLVRQLIPSDVGELRAADVRVLRPMMFFMTDGYPTDAWEVALRELHSPNFRERPTIVAIGFGTADPNILREVGGDKGRAFMISDTIDIRNAVDSISTALTSMLTSTVQSSITKAANAPSVPLPEGWLDLSSITDVS